MTASTFTRLLLMSLIVLHMQGCHSPQVIDKPFVPEQVPPLERMPDQGDRVKVGLLLPLSGEHAVLGKQLLNAAQLAIFSFQDHTVALLPRDTQSDPRLALREAEGLFQEGVELILGPLFATEVESLRAPALAHMIPIVSFTNNEEKAGQGVFAFGFSPDMQTDAILKFAASKGYRHFSALLPSTPLGQRLGERILNFAVEKELPMPTILYTDPQSKKWEFELEKLKINKTDVLFVPEGGKYILDVALYLKELGLGSIRLLGSGQWDDPMILLSPHMEGAWYPSNPGSRDWFNKTYEEAYGEKPQRLASLAFDMVSLAIVLSKDAPSQKPFSYQALVRPQGFRGIEGLFKMENSGKTQRQLSIFQIHPRGVKEMGIAGE